MIGDTERWECGRCHRTLRITFHTDGARPTKRKCTRCGCSMYIEKPRTPELDANRDDIFASLLAIFV